MKNALAERVKPLKASAIREIFKLLAEPGVISLAGGAPAPELFPTEIFAQLSAEIFRSNGRTALQYGITEGYEPLRELTRQRMKKIGLCLEEDLIITTGGQQAIELTVKSLVNEGDTVLCESPSFIGGLNCLRSYSANIQGIPMEEDGMDIGRLEDIVKKQKVKLVYTIPTFQNPTGVTMSLEKRRELLRLADLYDFYILEDNPYSDLRFKGEELPAIKSLDRNGRVVYCGSYTKILSPGLRLGWAVASPVILERMAVIKQVNDVHTNVFSQMLAAEFITRYSLEEHIQKGRDMYGRRCDIMLDSLERHMPDYVRFTRPEGGIFVWVTLPEEFDSQQLFRQCVERKVAFVPGATCMVDIEAPCPDFRLNYSLARPQQIELAIEVIADVIRGRRGA